MKDEGVGDNGPNERRVSLERGSWAGPAKDYHAAGRVGIATDGTQLVRVDWNTGEPSDPVDRSALGIGLIDRVHVEPNLPGTFVVQGSFRGYLTDLTETSRGLSMLATDAVFDVDTLDYLHAFKGARLEAWDVIDPLNPQAVANLNLNVSGSPVGVAWFFTQAAAEP